MEAFSITFLPALLSMIEEVHGFLLFSFPLSVTEIMIAKK